MNRQILNHTPENVKRNIRDLSSRFLSGHSALRLIADRLCYLAEGSEGLRTRHNMQRYDTKAKAIYHLELSEQLNELAEEGKKQKT